MSEHTVSLHDAIEGILPVKHLIYTHYEHKCEKDALNDDKAPSMCNIIFITLINRKQKRKIYNINIVIMLSKLLIVILSVFFS